MSEQDLYDKFSRCFDEEYIDDMVLLKDASDVAITDLLKNRYNRKESESVYTYIGPTIVSVNPYKKLDFYENEVKGLYHSKMPYELAPHLYSMAEDAFRTMKETGQGQAIVISGESGAGKTEAAKLIMEYIAAVSISGLISDNIKNIILKSNPVLEAFGNAKTVRNDNSSRFGKYIDLFFNFQGQMEGGAIHSLLLEKARVVKQRKGERNFHIFYQLCAGADDILKNQLGVDNAKKFNYLNQNEIVIKNVNDRLDFKQTQKAMVDANISINEQMELFRICAAILHLGNLKFKPLRVANEDGSEIENDDCVKRAAQLLGVEDDALKNCITFRNVTVNREVTRKPQNPQKAEYNRDALAKGIYEKIFLWLVRRINASIKRPDDDSSKHSIGVLDIYGFEIYKNNSLEQLNINFVNEKIQQQIQRWLQDEQDEYNQEGIPWTLTKLIDCDPCCKAIEDKPIGIYALLDEESLFPGGNDSNYLHKLNSSLQKNSAYEASRFKSSTFDLKHFAEKVTYEVEGWVEKNKDTMYDDLVVEMQKSTLDLMKQLFSDKEKNTAKGKLQKTIAQQFREDIDSLMTKLKGRRLHFIKCIKPNHEKKPNEFVDDVVLNQVRYLGIGENVQVRKAGYHFKLPYDKFLSRYKICSPKTFPRWRGTPKDGCEQILKDMNLEGKYALGKTKVFLRSPIQLFALDEMIQSKRADMAKIIQDNYRRYKARQVEIEQQHLTRALERTYGEKGPFSFKQVLNTVNLKGERNKAMIVVAPKAMYIVDPKSYAVLRRLPFDKLERMMCSALPDGIFIASCQNQYDTVFEADNKSSVMKAIRDSYELCTQKQLRVDINPEFQFVPKKGVTKSLKFMKNFGAKGTIIEATMEGLVVSTKPSDDVFDGKKLRRKNSFHKKYVGDYIRLQHSDLMKQIGKDYGDQHVLFSGVVVKYNKNYKRQDRVLLITERAVYNLDPNGYMINRRVPLRRIKGVMVSPLTDGFFIMNIPDEYDYLMESNKKTEILKVLSENYTAATRSTLKFVCKENLNYKAKKDGTMAQLKFLEDKNAKITTLSPKPYGADVLVKVDDVMSNDMQMEAVQDIYQGQKLRRRESLLRWAMGDYLHLSNSKIMAKITSKFGDSKLLYSGIVTKINNRYVPQDRKLLITDQAIYSLSKDGYAIKRRIPLKSIIGAMVSTMKDGFFVLRIPEEYDYVFASPNKTEIIKTIMDQYKRLYNKQMDLNVDDNIVYSPYKESKGRGIRTIQFKSDESVKQPTIIPTSTGFMVQVNNNEDELDQEQDQNAKKIGLKDDVTSVYTGRKRRRKESMTRQYLGDYMRLKENSKVKSIFKHFGDKELLFSSEVNKINKNFKSQQRIMLISDKAVYNIEPGTFQVKRRIPLDTIDGVSVSTLTDGNFCFHVPGSYDYLFESEKKSEIIDLISKQVSNAKQLKVNVSDKFEFCPNGNEISTISFVLDENVDSTFIESTNNGLVVHVKHEEPGVVLEAAYVRVKDQPKPIEIKSNEITLIKLQKRWKYKLEIRFYVNEHLQGCSFHEKIDTVTQRQEYISKISDLEPRDERYVISLPERRVVYSLLSKTRVKAKLVDPLGKVLLAVRFVYDVK